MNTNEIIYIDADMIGDDCTFEQSQAVAEKLTAAGYPAQAFDTCGSTPRGNYCESLQAENGRLRETLESARTALIGIQNGRYDVRQCGFIARLLESAIRE